MATVSHALTSTAKVKAHLGISGATYDTVIDTFVNGVTDFIESFCRRRFKETTYSNEQYDGGEPNSNDDYRKRVFLKNYPVSAVSAFEYRSGQISSPTWTAFSADDWLLYGNEGYVRYLGDYLPRGHKNLRVSYTAGYKIDFANETTLANHTLPFDITMVATKLAARMFDKRLSEGKSSENVEGQGIQWSASLSDAETAILSRYRKTVV